jgi:type II secretory pathway pseudopilin PulG
MLSQQRGFTYLTILFVIAVAGVMLATTGIDWSQAGLREKEQDLLFAGSQYRKAIMLYYERTPGQIKRYPEKLQDLLSDNRYDPPQHYLRKLYRDPILNQKEWGIIPAPGGGIMGVHSLSVARPIKQTNFLQWDEGFDEAVKYSDWQFTYTPRTYPAIISNKVN